MLRRSVKAGCLVVLLAAAPYCLIAAARGSDAARGGRDTTETTSGFQRSLQAKDGATPLSFKLREGECLPRALCTGT